MQDVRGEASDARSVVSGEVSSEVTTSTRRSTGTGLKKWMPITCSGRLVAMPSFMIGIDDVLEARMASSPSTTLSSPANTSVLSCLVLDHRLDDEFPVGQVGQVGRPADAAEGGVPLLLGQLAGPHAPVEAGRDPTLAGLDGAGVDLADHHVEAGPGADLGDARPHQAAAHHPDPLDHAHATDATGPP